MFEIQSNGECRVQEFQIPFYANSMERGRELMTVMGTKPIGSAKQHRIKSSKEDYPRQICQLLILNLESK